MVFDNGSDSRLLLDRGSALIEGLVGLAVVFLLLSLTVQAGIFLIARNAAESAVGSIARSAALYGSDLAAHEDQLRAMIAGTVPGATSIFVKIFADDDAIDVSAHFEWVPPGPLWTAVPMRISATTPALVPP